MSYGRPTAADAQGAIVRIADRIAYVNHDADDAARAGILSETDIPEDICSVLGFRYDDRINRLVLDMIVESGRVGKISLSPHIAAAFDNFRSFMYERVYLNEKAKSEESKVYGILSGLFNHYMKNPGEMTEEYRQIIETDGLKRAVSDYISGMTDNYAVHIYEKVYIPVGWQVR